MCRDDAFERLFGVPKRKGESDLSQVYMDMALAIQQVTEEVVLRLAKTARTLTGCANLVMAGGVALNCVANGKLLRRGIFKDIWIQPAAGDAGGALGSALSAWHIWMNQPRTPEPRDSMRGAYLGPEFSLADVKRVAARRHAPFEQFEDFEALCAKVCDLLAQGNVIGWFQGRMEYGPRALGNRSILGDPRNPEMQKKLNLKIKYREGFRPFAPSVLAEAVSECFEQDRPSPYMLLVAPVAEKLRHALPEGYWQMPMFERLYVPRSELPAITHVDFSARIQTVHKDTNPRYHRLIETFRDRHGCPVVVNTSFNVRGEPIVCTPADAYRCFMRTEMDYLVMGDCLFEKTRQPNWQDTQNWQEEYELD